MCIFATHYDGVGLTESNDMFFSWRKILHVVIIALTLLRTIGAVMRFLVQPDCPVFLQSLICVYLLKEADGRFHTPSCPYLLFDT